MTAHGSRIEGRAHLADDSPVSEARVLFTSAPVPLPDIAALTDSDGRFSLHAPSPGEYVLACHAEGLDPVTVPLEVPADSGTVQVDIELG